MGCKPPSSPAHEEVSPSQLPVQWMKRVTSYMQMHSLEATEKWLTCTFPETGIYILLDADFLLSFLRACDLQTCSCGDLRLLTEGCLAEKKMSWPGKWRLTQPVKRILPFKRDKEIIWLQLWGRNYSLCLFSLSAWHPVEVFKINHPKGNKKILALICLCGSFLLSDSCGSLRKFLPDCPCCWVSASHMTPKSS